MWHSQLPQLAQEGKSAVVERKGSGAGMLDWLLRDEEAELPTLSDRPGTAWIPEEPYSLGHCVGIW